MSFENRDYYRGEGGGGYRGGGMGMGGGRFSGVVKWLLIINVVIYLWDGIMLSSARGQMLALIPWSYFSVDLAIYNLQIWRFITYQFMHSPSDFTHILFNMIGLYFFGPLLERTIGSRRFLAFYLLCGVSGAVVASLLGAIPGLIFMPPEIPLVGASGSLFGILAACAVLFPNMRVMLLFPPIPMTMRTMAFVFLGIAGLSVLAGAMNGGGEAAHLGGALLGFVLIRNLGWLSFADGVSLEASRSAFARKMGELQKEQLAKEQKEVDRILDKVREKGLQSLSSREKKILQKATDRQRKAS
ncbi:rhomboid family intramembrane serine protease [Mucisphaera calidilacus]|uniref:Rhomboid protease AarA n=1 Tax=Mucisphaera calidilacus TaxID=2527982 RepID=A0A518BUR1_9BACT|nr:rhomboid family intramembrane serine protease [Mucisphaera calidilacus]QDU70720.1 Rhomboid protease AarA [Mucisphaera calidilacus]